jgi:hypothetical protein
MGIPSTEDFRDWLLSVLERELQQSGPHSNNFASPRGTVFIRKDPGLLQCGSKIQVNLEDGRCILINFQRLHNPRKMMLELAQRRMEARKKAERVSRLRES